MTEQQIPAPPERRTEVFRPHTDGAVRVGPPGPGMGWVRFGGVMMAVVGGFAVIEGLIAVFSPTYFVGVGGSVVALDFTWWGWIHLVLGVLVLATGISLLGSAPPWARGTGIALVVINLVAQLVFLPAYPIWSIVMIVLGVFVLYALVAAPAEDARRV